MFDAEIQTFHNKLNNEVLSIINPLKKAATGIDVANTSLSNLKAIVEKEDFDNVPEEIDFFKNIKPCPMSYLIYFSEMRSCETRKPKAGQSFKVRFLKKNCERSISSFIKIMILFNIWNKVTPIWIINYSRVIIEKTFPSPLP